MPTIQRPASAFPNPSFAAHEAPGGKPAHGSRERGYKNACNDDLVESAVTLARSLTRGSGMLRADAGPRRGRLRRMHGWLDTGFDDSRRIELAAFQHEMYRGNQLPFVEPHPGERDEDFARRVHLRTLNLTRVVIDVLSGLYRAPAERSLLGGEAAWHPLFEASWQASAPDAVLANADRLARLQGACAVQSYWHGGRLAWRVFPAHRFAVIENPASPAEPLAVVTLSAGPAWDAMGRWSGAAFADVWTSGEWMRVSGGNVVAREAHGYGCLPFTFVHDRMPPEGFWVEGRGLSLCYDNAVLNGRLSDLAEVIALQGFGIMEVVNPDPHQDIVLGPGRAVAFQTGGDMPFGINFKQPGAPIAEILEELRESVRHLLLAQRIPEHAISVSVSGVTSGIAIHAANTPVVEDRLERARSFGAVEEAMYRVSLAVAGAHTGMDAGSAPRLRVKFAEPDVFRAESERQRRDEWLLANGMATPWQIMFRDNPDGFASLEEAKAAWLAQRAELAGLT